MSEPGPESIPTSADRLSARPTKKRALTPVSAHATSISALFARPVDKPLDLPPPPSTSKALPPPPEIVPNVQGSSAGAGSGEFHVYKASRRREMERVRMMEEEVAKEEGEKEFREKMGVLRRRDEMRTSRNKAKREKAKARREKAKCGGSEAVVAAPAKEGNENGAEKIGSGKIVPRAVKADETPDTAAAPEVQAVEEVGIVIHDDG
jgi:hypothetical protein